MGVTWIRIAGALKKAKLGNKTVVTPPASTRNVYLLPGKAPSGPNTNDGNPYITPIGSGAVLVDALLGPANAYQSKITEDAIKLGLDPSAPIKDMLTGTLYNQNTVTPNYNFPAGTKVRVPATLSSDGAGNSCAALLSDDLTNVWQGQTLHLTAGGNPSWPYTIPARKVSLTGADPAGSHGGSALSSVMGTLRAWEFNGSEPITHALNINLYAAKYLRGLNQSESTGYRWPATVADSYWNNSTSASRYGHLGSPPVGMKMGVLLTLPTNYNFSFITHPLALRMAQALWGFGGYVVDDTAWDVHAFSVESTVASAFVNLPANFHSEMQTVMQDLHLVSNNAANNIGGGGTFRLTPPGPV